jgi:hypothetical protein
VKVPKQLCHIADESEGQLGRDDAVALPVKRIRIIKRNFFI